MEENTEGKAEKFFKDFGKKMDSFLVEVKDAGTRLEADMQQKYEELKVAAERIKKKRQRIKSVGKRWRAPLKKRAKN